MKAQKLRQVEVAAVGLLARAWARVLRGSVTRHDGMWVCSGLPHRCFPRGGVTWGNTYVTGRAAFMLTPERIRHERVHVEQWHRYGLRFAWLYLRAGRDPHSNRFEIEAGLEDGGYG